MKWYADESVEKRIVDALRAAGHDVVAVSEIARAPEMRTYCSTRPDAVVCY
ncbi:MAG: DUF5615 family PIN-like protein [Armatimonadota bacterium]